MFHVHVGERNPSEEGIKKLTQRISSGYNMQYFTISPTHSVCPTHRRFSGEWHECPTCGKTCEVFARIVGYYRPVSQWNAGKKSEFAIRRTYTI